MLLTLGALSATDLGAAKPVSEDPLDGEALERAGAVIGEIVIVANDVFDTTSSKENKSIFRAANRIHIVTRRNVIASQLLFATGEPYVQQRLEESERLLRQNAYIYDASVRPTAVRDGVVEVTVTTRDNWTLLPQLSYSRKGGETEYLIGVEEKNLLGRGSQISLTREDDGDRRSTLVEYADRNVRDTWVGLDLSYRNSDDGNRRRVSLARPFFSLTTRWSAGFDVAFREQEDTLFSRGEDAAEFRREDRFATAWFGWSRGLRDGWTRRWTAGLIVDESDFEPVPVTGLLQAAPADRNLRYPFLRYDAIENRFTTARNLNQIALTEDVYVGTRYGITLGYIPNGLGADRSGAVFAADTAFSHGDPEDELLTWSARIDGRLISGNLENTFYRLRGQYYRRRSEHRVWYAALEAVVADRLDLDRTIELGGQTGLRGYPRAYANGDARAVLTLEQRYITDWYPFRLFRVGGALFFDAGRVWGTDVTGRDDDRVLSNIGFGLRLASTRGESNRMIHIDIAYPLRRDEFADGVEISIEGKRGF